MAQEERCVGKKCVRRCHTHRRRYFLRSFLFFNLVQCSVVNTDDDDDIYVYILGHFCDFCILGAWRREEQLACPQYLAFLFCFFSLGRNATFDSLDVCRFIFCLRMLTRQQEHFPEILLSPSTLRNGSGVSQRKRLSLFSFQRNVVL